MNMVHESKEDAILKWLVKYDSSLLLMHHRFPTSTINVKRAAHPFSTKKYFGDTQYILVHNGGISNAEELFCDHQALGIEYYSLLQDLTFNDSEALLWDFALTMEGKQRALKAKGGMAFICLQLVKGKLVKMYFGRNTNPLHMLRTDNGISLSSEGEGELIKPDTLHTWNYTLKRLTTRQFTIPSYFRATNYSPNYDAYGNWNPAGAYTPDSYAGSRFGGDNWRDGLKEDDGSYDWEDESYTDRAGGRIKNVLARQFGHLFPELGTGEPVIPRRKVIEYEQDPETQMMLPVGTKINFSAAKTHEEQRKLAEQALVDRKKTITDEEVTTEYMAYLAGSKGHFEQTYWALECDYERACDLPDTLANIRQRLLIEKVMEKIDSDPEYINEESVSNLWRTIWLSKV